MSQPPNLSQQDQQEVARFQNIQQQLESQNVAGNLPVPLQNSLPGNYHFSDERSLPPVMETSIVADLPYQQTVY